MPSHHDAFTSGAPSQPPALPAQDQYVPHCHWLNQPSLNEPGMQLGSQPMHVLPHSQPTGFVAEAMVASQHHVPHVHWQSDVSHPGHSIEAQPHGCHMPVGGIEPIVPANFAQYDVGNQPMQFASHTHHDAQPHGCHMPVGGSEPIFPANFAQHDGVGFQSMQPATLAQHDVQPAYGCHNMPVGGNEPILPPNFVQHDVGNQPMQFASHHAQHDAQPHGCHMPVGGDQPMVYPSNFVQPDNIGSLPMQPMFHATVAQYDGVGFQSMQPATHAQHDAQPDGCHMLGEGGQPIYPSSFVQHDVQPASGCQYMPVGGNEPISPANFVQYDGVGFQSMQPATHAQHDAQPDGCHMLGEGGQPIYPSSFVQHDVQPASGCQYMPVGGNEPISPANFVQYDGVGFQSMQPATHAQHDAQPDGCHMPVGGGEPMFHATVAQYEDQLGRQALNPVNHGEHAQLYEHVFQPSVQGGSQYELSSDIGQLHLNEPVVHDSHRGQPLLPFATHDPQLHHDALPSSVFSSADHAQVLKQAASNFVPQPQLSSRQHGFESNAQPNAGMSFAPGPSAMEGLRSMQDLPGAGDLVPCGSAGNHALAPLPASTSNTDEAVVKSRPSRPHALVRAHTEEDLPEKIAVVQIDAGTTLTATICQDGETAEWEWARAVSFMGMKTNKHHLYLSRNLESLKAELETAEVAANAIVYRGRDAGESLSGHHVMLSPAFLLMMLLTCANKRFNQTIKSKALTLGSNLLRIAAGVAPTSIKFACFMYGIDKRYHQLNLSLQEGCMIHGFEQAFSQSNQARKLWSTLMQHGFNTHKIRGSMEAPTLWDLVLFLLVCKIYQSKSNVWRCLGQFLWPKIIWVCGVLVDKLAVEKSKLELQQLPLVKTAKGRVRKPPWINKHVSLEFIVFDNPKILL